MNASNEMLETLIKQIISQHLGGNAPSSQASVEKRSGAICVKTATVKPEKMDTGKAGAHVAFKDLATPEESPRMGFGVMEMENTTLEWTREKDEVNYVIEGRLEVTINGEALTAEKGDLLFIPQNTEITVHAPVSTRFVYVACQA